MKKFSKVLFLSVLILAIASLLAGCPSTPTTNNATANNANRTNTAPNTSVPGNTAPNSVSNPENSKPASNTDTAATTGDSIGVPECDEYIKKYEACVFSASSKVPQAMKDNLKSSFEQSRAAWKQAASNPQSKAALASGCKQAMDTAKQSLSTYCEW